MSDAAKIPFSQAEMQLIKNAEVFLTKKKALAQVMQFLSKLQVDLLDVLKEQKIYTDIIDEFNYRKISQGESYRSMPYQVSDFPAKFDKDNIFTVRCLVWWGNEVSVHLLLQGEYCKRYFHSIQSNIANLPHGFFTCIAATPWEHHFEEDNYVPISSSTIMEDATFLKIGKKYALDILTKGNDDIVNDILSLLRLLTIN